MYGQKFEPYYVAIDFDDTITLYPDFFKKLIELFQSHGDFDIMIVTARYEDGDHKDIDDFNNSLENPLKVFFTNCIGKDQYMSDQGIDIDLWIDDCGLCITHSWDGFAAKADEKHKQYIH